VSTATDLHHRWRYGARQRGLGGPPAHIGPAKPNAVAYVRIGRLRHAYDVWDGPPVDALVAGGYIRERGEDLPKGWPAGPVGGYGRQFWQNWWTPADGEDGVFTELPNVVEWSVQQNFENNGIAVLSLTVENIAYPVQTGPGGNYHVRRRGWFSPSRGYEAPDRPALTIDGREIGRNRWFRMLNSGSCQIKVWAGYGDALVPVFVGLVDDCDPSSQPDKLEITARDHGQALTDMRLFGWNKEPRIMQVVFQDRLRANDAQKVGREARASSSSGGHPASAVLSTDSDDFWQSQGRGGPDNTEWIEITLPAGRYEQFYLYPRYAGMDMWVSLNVNAGSTLGNQDLPAGWVDLGAGNVPGPITTPFIRHREGLAADGQYFGLKNQEDGRESYRLTDGARLRVHFRGLRRQGDGQYHAAVNRMFANRLRLEEEAKKQHWILIDDVADMVRVVLRWAGFKNWEVEQTGVRLPEKVIFPPAQFYIDVIRWAQELTGFVFYISPPTAGDDSLGIPVFRKSRVTDLNASPRATIRDTDLLTGIRAKDSDEPRAYIIRVRGRTAKEKAGGEPLATERTKRLMYVFKPPGWTRLGGIVKHQVTTRQHLKTIDGCKFGCYLIALGQLLEASKATCGFPAFPAHEDETSTRRIKPRHGVELDTHVAVFDIGTGLTTRLWLSELTTEFRRAEQGSHFTQSVGGTLVDTPEVRKMVTILNEATFSGEH
jgi:hypothetical protein